MPTKVNLELIIVWFCVGFFVGAGWAVATWLVSRILPHPSIKAHLPQIRDGCAKRTGAARINPTYCAETFSGRLVFALGDRPKVVFDIVVGNGLIVEINLMLRPIGST